MVIDIIAATLAAFSGVLSNDFVNGDDGSVIVDNPHIRRFSIANDRWMFTAAFAGHDRPLPGLSYTADYVVWGGLSAAGVHLTNLLLHVIVGVVFFFVCHRLIAADMGIFTERAA